MPSRDRQALGQITEVARSRERSLKGLVYSTISARGRPPSREDLEDVLSDAYLDAARLCLRDPIELENPEAWFKRVVFYRCLRFLRNQATDPSAIETLDELEDESRLLVEIDYWDPSRRLLLEELAKPLHASDKEILSRFAEGYTSREIGSEFDLRPSTVRKRLSRAFVTMRAKALETD